MGMTHGNANTFPHLAKPICYVPAGDVVDAAEAVIKLFRDHGNRADRSRARIKYVVHDWGVEQFREVLAGLSRRPLALPRAVEVDRLSTCISAGIAQGDGKWFYGLSVENGRVKDEGELPPALRPADASSRRFSPELRLTPIAGRAACAICGGAKAGIERTAGRTWRPAARTARSVRKHSMACPADPDVRPGHFRGGAALPGIIDELEAEMKNLGLEDERISVRMTGCPNGCARPYQSDIGIVGRSGDKYASSSAARLGRPPELHALRFGAHGTNHSWLEPLLNHFKHHRLQPESFGEFCQRLGLEALQSLLPPERLAVKAHGHFSSLLREERMKAASAYKMSPREGEAA